MSSIWRNLFSRHLYNLRNKYDMVIETIDGVTPFKVFIDPSKGEYFTVIRLFPMGLASNQLKQLFIPFQ